MTEWLKEAAMLLELPQDPMLIAGGAFLLGWIIAKIGAALSRRFKAGKRDPRDDRIRSMDAELRIAQGQVNKLKTALEEQEKQVAKIQKFVEDRDEEALKRTGVIEKLSSDLKESVQKTRELRTELTDRATENIKSEVKLREVETELSVAQASSDMITTGILDYSMESSEKDKDDK
jgi:chromosome segregation ATPase